jgi:LacI family transcriptional regulator
LKIMKLPQESGSTEGKKLRAAGAEQGRGRHILLLLEWYDYRIHRGVARVAREYGWELICPKEPLRDPQFLEERQVDGSIVLLQGSERLVQLRERGIPFVDLGLKEHGIAVTRVVTDNKRIGWLASEHFREHGYREVLTLDPGGNRMYEERMEALREAMEVDGGTVTTLCCTEIRLTQFLEELEAVARRRGQDLAEWSVGFFGYTDLIAGEMISFCIQNGIRVPENVAVLGVDNDDLVNAGLTVELSSLDSDQEGLGMTAARILRELMDGGEEASRITFRHPPRQVLARKSTDCFAVNNRLVAGALHWISKNYYRGIQAIDVAEAMGVTQQGLQKAFLKHYSRTPAREIRHQRITAVRNLLLTTDASIERISRNCGFYSVNSMINAFRQEYRTTPGNYRRRRQPDRALGND